MAVKKVGTNEVAEGLAVSRIVKNSGINAAGMLQCDGNGDCVEVSSGDRVGKG
jgi:hypothetical protein